MECHRCVLFQPLDTNIILEYLKNTTMITKNEKYINRMISFKLVVFQLITMILLLCSVSSFAQIKIYVETDLEGVSGVYKFAQSREKDTPLNIQACEYFMGDLAAVVRGLRDGGATEIMISDGHGSGALLPHLMEPGAKYITGKPRPEGKDWSLDKTYAGVVFFGFHAMMGTPDGVLNHTQNSKGENRYWYNGVESGELAQSAIVAGYYGVAPILVTGDVATCREATKFFGPEVITVATKQGISREAAVLYPFAETRKSLYEGAKKAMSAISKCKPYILQVPAKAKLEYLDLDPKLPKPKLVTREWTITNAGQIFGR
jgi:D-amino peptidase